MSSNKFNASDLFVQALENEGVEVIYGIPGEENLDLLESIRKSNIKLILTRHEQAAGFMAATYGRLTGKVGVAISTLGPGATNFTTPAAYATLGGFPVLFITGQKPIKKSKQGKFQVIDVVGMMKPITKYSKVIVSVNNVTSTIREAFRLALEEKQGAVHIEFPEDVSAEEVLEDTKGLFVVSSALMPSTNIKAVEKAVELIKTANLPLLLIGSSANRNNASQALTNLVNKVKIPFFTTQMGKGVVDDDNEYFIGTASLSGNDYLHTLVAKADLIINVGYDPIEKPPYFLSKNSKTKVIHINNVSALIDEIYNPELEVLGDIFSSVNELTNKLGVLEKDFSYAFKVKDFLSKQINSFANDNSYPIKPQKLVLDIDKIVGKNGYIALDNGMYKLWFARNFTVHKPYGMILDNALATMGAGLPSAMEIARLYPNERVLAIVGDGGFMMNSQEIETALRLKLNVVVVILNDSAYGMIEWKQAGMGFANYGMKFNNPDFVKYAESYGAKGYRLTKTEDFASLLEKCFNEKGVCVIDVPIDYSENDKFFNIELSNKKEIK